MYPFTGETTPLALLRRKSVALAEIVVVWAMVKGLGVTQPRRQFGR
jgi:hypothetical protein